MGRLALSGMRIHALIALALLVHAKTHADQPKPKEVACATFVSRPESSCPDDAWQGSYKDQYSPDDICPHSKRFVRVGYPNHPDGKLHVSANGTDAHCDSSWGKLFSASTVDPIVLPMSKDSCKATVSFRTKVPAGAPVQPYVLKGALDFVLTLGSIGGVKAIRFSGMYMGDGGTWLGSSGDVIHAGASMCDNMWLDPHARVLGHELFARVTQPRDEESNHNLSTALLVVIGVGILFVGIVVLVAQYRRKHSENTDEVDQLHLKQVDRLHLKQNIQSYNAVLVHDDINDTL